VSRDSQHAANGSPALLRLNARIAELSQDPLVRTDPWSLITVGLHSKLVVALGVSPSRWEGGKKIDGDSVLKGMNIWYNQATPLMQSACDGAIGARKVLLITPCIVLTTAILTHLLLCFEGVVDNNQAHMYTHGHVPCPSVYHGGERGALPSRDG
jgi:hypothetical protein